MARQYLGSRQKADTSGAAPMFESEMTPDALAAALNELATQSYGAGVVSAQDQLGLATAWDTWQPGYAAAAEQLAGGGLQDLLDAQGVTIQSILDGRIGALGSALEDAVSSGASIDQTAGILTDLLSNPDYADMIANTETNRAMSAASMDEYRANGVAEVDWLLSGNPCPECEENADAAPIPLGEAWPNDDPPVHPSCECSLAPADTGSTGEAAPEEI